MVGTLFALGFALAFARIRGLTIFGSCGFGVGGGASLGSGVVVFLLVPFLGFLLL